MSGTRLLMREDDPIGTFEISMRYGGIHKLRGQARGKG